MAMFAKNCATGSGLPHFSQCNWIPLTSFWFSLRAEYQTLASIALKKLVQYASSYSCETAFSRLVAIKTKKRNRLINVEEQLRLSTTGIQPRWKKLCDEMQDQGSH